MTSLTEPLTDDQKLMVEAIHSGYLEKGQWPTWKYVKQEFRHGSDSDPLRVRNSFPYVGTRGRRLLGCYCAIKYDPNGTDDSMCRLFIAAGLHVGSYASTAIALVEVIRFFARTIKNVGPHERAVKLTRDKIAGALNWDPNAMLRLPDFLHHEPRNIVGGSPARIQNWSVTLNRVSLLPYMDVSTVRQYVEKTVEIIAAQPRPKAKATPPSPTVGVRTAPAVLEQVPEPGQRRRQVFVVHGRNARARDAMFTFLRALDLRPIEWTTAISLTGKTAPYIGEVLDAAFDAAQAIVVLMTPDEITYLRNEYAESDNDAQTRPAAQARPNVLFEAGMAMGRAPDRTVLVELGEIRPFSDVAGRHVVKLGDGAPARRRLAERLRSAGCAVDDSGDDWLTAGDFTPPD